MQFLTNAIVTTLVVFVLLLPAFIVLRVFWGSSRGDIHADNIYSYLVWGIPLSILIYSVYYEAKIYKILDRKHSFPTYAIWNLFANSSNKVDSSGNDVKRITNYMGFGYTDSIYETSLLSRRISKPVFDTVRVINGNPDDTTGLASIYSYVISKGINNNTRSSISKSRKLIKTVTHTYPVKISPAEYQTPNPPRISLFSAKGYLLKQFFFVLALCFLLSILFKRLLQFFGLDRVKHLRFQSYLHYLLSGREKKLKETKRLHFITLLKRKYRVQVDLLCQIGDKMKIYRGYIKEFKVRDDCLEYLVLEETKRGNLLSEKLKDEPIKPIKDNLDVISFSINDETLLASVNRFEAAEVIKLLKTSPDFGNSANDLDFIPIDGEIMYFNHDEIKNINIEYKEVVKTKTQKKSKEEPAAA